MACFNVCSDTCRYHQDRQCQLLGDDCLQRCKCPEGYLMDETGQCVRKEQCECYHNGTAYPPGFNISYPDECKQCTCDENSFTCTPIPDCCIYGNWTEWSDCDATCKSGVQTRTKVGLNPECPGNLTESRPCEGPCVCIINGTEYENGTTFYPPDDQCSICTCMNNETLCGPDPNLIDNSTWADWGEWSICSGSSNCRNYTRMRCRFCNVSECGNPECAGPSIDVEPCSNEPCCEVYTWSEWSDCSARCGDGLRSRYKMFADPATARDCNSTGVLELETCGNCLSCPESEDIEWSAWSACTSTDGATCGLGRRSRNRPGPDCPGIKLQEEETCFLGPCDCRHGLVYSNYSKCQPTCLQTFQDPSCLLVQSPGCVCPAGKVMDNGECVDPLKCQQCVYQNKTYKPGEQWECGNCSLCQCCGGHITTVPRECPDITKCNLTTHRLVPSDDECCPIKCEEKKCELKKAPAKKIWVGDCVSQRAIQEQYCEGECKASSLRVDYTKSTLGEKECSCCAANIASYKIIHLDCPDGSTKEHEIPILEKCFCDLTICPTRR